MRSLFPNVDYFVTAPVQALETITFLQLPVPQVSPSPPPLPISAFSDLLFLRLGSAFDVSLPIEKLPIETALSKFFADVFPQDVEICVEDFEDDFRGDEARLSEIILVDSRDIEEVSGICVVSIRLFLEVKDEIMDYELHQEAKILNEEKEVESQGTHGSEATEIELSKQSNGRLANDMIIRRREMIQFETPELDVFADNDTFFENEGIQILYKASEMDKSLDMLNSGLATHHPFEVQESFLSVEDLTFEYPMERKANSEDDCSFQDQIRFNQISFPTLEVNEIVLEYITGFSVEENLLLCLQNIELHPSQKDNLDTEVNELWGMKEYDISGFISDHFLSGQSFGSEDGPLDNFPEVDLVSLIEIPQIKMNFAVQGMTDCNCLLPDQPVVLQEFHMLDVDSSQTFEALFKIQPNYEPETGGWMFSEDMNFKNFNNLVVSHELTLADHTFKSLPVPVICDHQKLHFFYAIIEEKLASLKPHPVSALDGIYLDWHLLEEDKHSCNTFYYQNILGDMVSHRIDFDWVSSDNDNVVYDFVLSDDIVHGFNMEENSETKEFLSDVCISTGITLDVESSSKFPQSDDQEQLAKKNSDRASLLFKSMSQSNDLDYFLNAQKATIGTNSQSATRPVNNKATSSKVPLGISVAATCQGGESITISDMTENVDKQKELVDSLPMDEKYRMRAKETTDRAEAQSLPIPTPSMPFAKEYKHPNGDLASLPETVILVNTQNLDKEMIVSRRSSYQRILAIEKEGAQVVERDSDLPVDIIINSAICLLWYNCRNIGKKATALDEASSCLPLYIENIATNVLTLLSFSFSGCIMVFEGDESFLSTVMELSDGLYAAAASLGIDMQMFCSYSSELTDEIIMSCIQYATRGVFPRMPESETLAESFLTKFPSVNPLTAHAILSSGGTLIEFLGSSDKRRTHAIQKYQVPDESITLLGALCKYGEREDSRSIMTDCSSSVSSGTDSKSFNLNTASKRKRWTYDGSLNNRGTHMDDLLRFDSANQFSKDTMYPLVEKPHDSFMSKDPKTFDEFRNPRLYDSNLFNEEWDSEMAVMMDPSVIPKQHGFQISEEPQMLKKISNAESSFNEKMSGQLEARDEAMWKNFDRPDVKGSWILSENQKGEVIDLTGSPRSAKRFYSIAESVSFMMSGIEKDAAGKSKAARRLSFGQNHQTTLPTSAEVFSGKDIWTSVKDRRHNFQVGARNYSDMDLGDDISIIKHPNKLLEDCFKQRSTEKSHGLQFQENESSLDRGTPLSNALSFSTPGHKSPWTMEFLNKIRDKSRLLHQSLPCDTSANHFSFSGNIAKDAKRRSPSILEFFKYQGGSTRRVPDQKKQKRSLPSASSLKIEKPLTSASVLRAWTPLDKRAQKKLSFTINNGERQTKLIWNDGSGTHNLSNKFRNQI